MRQHFAGLVAPCASFQQLYSRISTQRQHLGLPVEAVAVTPELRARRGDFQAQAVRVGNAINLVSRLGVADSGVCEGHSHPVEGRAGWALAANV